MGCSSSSVSDQVISINENSDNLVYKKRFTEMEYKYFGKSGLKVSSICFSAYNLNIKNLKKSEFTNVIKKAYSLGINFYETSEQYCNGQLDVLLGEAFQTLAIPREELVISQTIRQPEVDQIQKNNKKTSIFGHSHKQIIESVKNSLNRLQISYLDIVYCDRFDEDTPLEETIKAFNHLIKQGLVNYWGTSRWTAAQIFEARCICAKLKLSPPVIQQVEYNMLFRDTFEVEYSRLFDKYKVNSTIWNPFCFDILNSCTKMSQSLSSKLKQIKEKDQYAVQEYNYQISENNLNQIQNIIKKISLITKKLECTFSQLAMAWILANRDATSVIFCTNNQNQLEEIVESIEIAKLITPEINSEIDNILSNLPILGLDFKTFSPKKGRREKYLVQNQNQNINSIQT
ncbi:aldo/keto reductase family oxidoreductase (macronuclear) [Tetrahymena thermophila SB210]|uniref:Aldo/keto reductase family oxidoreductase n=1 Tax=Tetrahymena thermophila (strain SB210) TaxID=312017 RepID=I7MM59_TETTS|nr:aldo/keto reductase family oxidoreductase [Tetrahymena thermophila SB210]EAS04220.2 aldo/keto reductase family oxidoreductase [Tetrahymena thermophila SB210]|eukprot:XP_001024465.2 aldo/keto reductase family oxidoreductase [Tetrahymena thermophila SB210]